MENKNILSQAREPMSRRNFLRLSGLAGLGLASVGFVPPAAEAVNFNRNMKKVSNTKLAMGTVVSMTLIHPSRDEAQEAMALAFEEINRLTSVLSRFDDTTAVSILNRKGKLEDIPGEVAYVVARALDHHRISGGAFDITVKPVIDLFRKKYTRGRLAPPDKSELENALRLVGSNGIQLKGRSIRFNKPGMGITLDGIAKGYIVDRASEILSAYKIENHLINAGGDIRSRGSRQQTKPWTIAIQDPRKNKQYPDVIHMTDGAIATSGNYEVYFDREKMFHHIVDPRTGMSPLSDASVSVMAQTATDADALSTSVFVMDPLDGVRFIDSIPGCECLVVTRTGKLFMSGGWRKNAAT